jgi:hypothetical protein
MKTWRRRSISWLARDLRHEQESESASESDDELNITVEKKSGELENECKDDNKKSAQEAVEEGAVNEEKL